MRLIVDKMPIDKSHCPFHKYVSDIGEIINKSKCICRIDKKECCFKTDSHVCRWLNDGRIDL